MDFSKVHRHAHSVIGEKMADFSNESFSISYEPQCENLSSGFPTRSDINKALQPQKMARGLKFWRIVLSM